MNPPQNQRAHLRVPIQYRVKLVAGDELIAYSRALNVSMGGILLKTPPSLPLGLRVGVAIFLEDKSDQRIVTQGTVVRSDTRGLAIQFTNGMEVQHATALEALVAAHAPEAAGA